MTRYIVFHSDNFGTGKTTVACNLAAMLAAKEYNVGLLDGNFYAPSLYAYFDKTPDRWINDLFWRGAEVKDIMVDMTDVVDGLVISANSSYSNYAKKKNDSSGGKLWVGFCNPKLEEIYNLHHIIEMNGRRQDVGAESVRMQILRKLVWMREELSENNFNFSYVIMDIGAGLTYWSINLTALSDIIFLTLNPREVNIEKTRKIVNEMYSSFTTKYGLKVYLILNRVERHCNYIISYSDNKTHGIFNVSELDELNFIKRISHDLSLDVLSTIPCYQDIDSLGLGVKEFLSALKYPNHPFAREIELLASAKEVRI
jgi:MinD-like ATPase involved in chromosome partitioning or flagellar assembly